MGNLDMAFKTIYLTGAPASGKSSTVKRLQDTVQPLEVWEYGARLTTYIQERDANLKDQADLRTKSAGSVTPKDIETVDAQLISFVEEKRSSCNIIIDTHPVTKEAYGFRITAFSLEQIQRLKPDEIWVLYTVPEVALSRIAKDAQGRRSVSIEEARMHTAVQSSVAATYGIATGRPVYLFDTDRLQDEIVDQLSRRLT
jgi:adenylate kinase